MPTATQIPTPIRIPQLTLCKQWLIIEWLIIVLAISGCANQNSIQNFRIADDKLKHLAVTTVMSAAVADYKKQNGATPCEAAQLGFVVSMSIGAGKETYDKYIKKTEWSWPDIAWDLVGSSVGSIAGSGCH